MVIQESDILSISKRTMKQILILMLVVILAGVETTSCDNVVRRELIVDEIQYVFNETSLNGKCSNIQPGRLKN